MPKRKLHKPDADSSDGDGDDASDRSLVDVDFEFFDPNPELDYLALKRLATQLFVTDAELLPLHDLADLILAQPLVGTTVKCDGRESDPYAVLTVLNLQVHQNNPAIKAVIEYALNKAELDPAFHAALQGLIGPAGLASQNHVGLVFSERLINMPVQVVPHMYRMLADEIQWAIDDNEPYRFTHLLFISRIYRLTPEEEAEMQEAAPRNKRQKQSAPAPAPSTPGVYSFHSEDEDIQKIALHSLDYNFTRAQPRGEEAFGLDMGGRMMLVPGASLPQLVNVLQEKYSAPP
ncbi:hypothetical protein CERSUDRAFT_101946 [Gelatoporia subvermispora B]|uniref:Protein BCP1 n=1 Tax=Ceriporiopsis subvermispora (strain B) TaxID=914234 RepID=M2RAR8_CERS8|nr:hypothetical protein CERSUDRAFT_101946 [Gelatoporia subvermispora B]